MCIRDSDYPKYIERARRCGFDALEIFYGRTLTMPQSEVDEIVAACKANDVELYISGGFGPEYDLASFDESTRQAGVKNSITLLKAMARLGAKNFSGINYAPWCKFDTAFEKAKATETAAKSLREIGKACADYDFSWNMEAVSYTHLDVYKRQGGHFFRRKSQHQRATLTVGYI